MFGANSHADKASQGATEERMRGEQAEEEWRFHRSWIAESFGEEAMNHHLEGLRDTSGKLAAGLDVGEGEPGDDA